MKAKMEYLSNGKFFPVDDIFKSWDTTNVVKIPYLGNNTKWNYYFIFSTILSSCNIIRATKNVMIPHKRLSLKQLEKVVGK